MLTTQLARFLSAVTGALRKLTPAAPLQSPTSSQPTVFSSGRTILYRCFWHSAYSHQRTIQSGASCIEKVVKIAMSAAQRRCQILLLQSIAKLVDCQWHTSSSLTTRLTALQFAQPLVSLVPQQKWSLDGLARRHTYHKNYAHNEWIDNHKQIFPRPAQHNFSLQAGALCNLPCITVNELALCTISAIQSSSHLRRSTDWGKKRGTKAFRTCAAVWDEQSGTKDSRSGMTHELSPPCNSSCLWRLTRSDPWRMKRALMQAFHDVGWTREAVYNVPNAISLARLISGPFVAYFILHEHWAIALGTLAVAGASDWADGYAAKHYGQSSVLGSYLDPLADKVLVCCTVGALAQQVGVSS